MANTHTDINHRVHKSPEDGAVLGRPQSSDPQGGGEEGVASAIEHSSDRTQQSSSSAYHTLLVNRHVLDPQDLLCYNSSATELNID